MSNKRCAPFFLFFVVVCSFFSLFLGARVGEQGRGADNLEPDIGAHRQHEGDVAREAYRAAGRQLPKGEELGLRLGVGLGLA